MKKTNRPAMTFAYLLLGGVIAGFANGLLGAGGGIIIVVIFSRLLSAKTEDKNDIFANALCVMLPLSLLSYAIYWSRGHIGTEGFGVFIIPALLGGALGGLLLGKLKAVFVRRLFASLVIISGILLAVR